MKFPFHHSCFFLYMLIVSFSVHFCRASDCLENGSMITDGKDTMLVSPGKVFEFGFFTPDGSPSKTSRYLGIWYYNSNPKTVVWVANRDRPMSGLNGKVVSEGGQAEVMDVHNTTYWKTDTVGSVNSTELCLNDEGNLVLSSDQGKNVLWQSFDHPTDTLLPGMKLSGRLNLTSWKNRSDPGLGTAHLLLKSGVDPDFEVQENGYPAYWNRQADTSAKVPIEISDLLSKGSLANDTRLVMNFTVLSGQVQLWKKGSNGSWSLNWFEPRDRCSFDSVCGTFGSCNSNNGYPCKCLPGFKPSSLPDWDAGCYTGGCMPKSGYPSQRENYVYDRFLKFTMMKVGEKDCSVYAENVDSEEGCKGRCLENLDCVACSYGLANCNGTGTPAKQCLTWTSLHTLVEQDSKGITLFVRAPSSDIELTSRDCKPCGAYAIPYPLSTDGASCGDSSYFNLHCNSTTGQVNFSTITGPLRVTLIDPDKKSLYIQVTHASSCDSKYLNSFVLSPNNPSPFYVKHCSIFKDNPLIQVEQPFIEVEIGWKPPLEPTCSEFSDCLLFNHTSCKAAKGGKRRCICKSGYHWDGSKLECTKAAFPLVVVLCCTAFAVATILLCGLFFLYCKRKGKVAEKQRSIKLIGEDHEDIDVPFFGWGSILAATNQFADANKLGTGGFGSVYRGRLPDGKEIAVKRLSTKSTQGVAEFRTEVMLIAKLQHRNLVKLLGYCVKSGENILVYEYMPNGSLDSCLFDRSFSSYLDWGKRFDIIFGIARGLVYLHQDSRLRVVHRDLKPSNILLDEELNPKISDFGIARIVGGQETEANTNKVVGTYGYMSPEYACEGFFSFKSDVFSFGVVVLETISGKRNSRSTVFDLGLSLLGHAWRLWNEDKGLEFIDPALKDSYDPIQVLKCIQVGLLCVQDDPVDRPTMSTVVLMLSNESSVSHSFPKKPSFFNKTSSSSEIVSTSSIGGSSFFDNMITVSTVGR